MSISDKLGGLTFFWDWSPVVLALVVLAIDFGIVNALMAWPEKRYNRPRWRSFLYGDLIFLPALVLFAGYALRHMDGHPGRFYAQTWWHIGVLIVGAVMSVGLEVVNVTVEPRLYSLEQEFRPSKLWHTIIFPVMFYIMVTGLMPLLREGEISFAAVFAYFAAICFLLTLVADDQWKRENFARAQATH